MDGIVMWVVAALGVLLLVAMAVARAEYLIRQDQLRRPEHRSAAAPMRVASVDVSLDAPATGPAGTPDSEASGRREMLDGVLGRMAQRGSGSVTDSRRGWVDTAPMVGPGPGTGDSASVASAGAAAAAPASPR